MNLSILLRKSSHQLKQFKTNHRTVSQILSHTIFKKTKPNTNAPIIFIHGIMGSKSNWRSFAKSDQLQDYDRIIVDIRNHGDSFHDGDMSYKAMGDDIVNLVKELGYGHVNLVGHSMGGRISMSLALRNVLAIEKLLVIDITPSDRALDGSDPFLICNALKDYEFDGIKSRSEAFDQVYAILKPIIKGEDVTSVVHLALKGAVHNPVTKELEWKTNWKNIFNVFSEKGFDDPGVYHKDTVCIYGTKSHYVDVEKDREFTEQLFPNIIWDTVKSGHYPHVEVPNDLMVLTKKYLN